MIYDFGWRLIYILNMITLDSLIQGTEMLNFAQCVLGRIGSRANVN